MIRCIHRDANLAKQIRTLRRGGGSGREAADHAEAIIQALIEPGAGGPKQPGRLTRFGEARIKNCVKYDLVHGYRLIGVRSGREIAFLFIGSHDECDHWIRNNTGIEPLLGKKRSETIRVATSPSEEPPEAESEEESGPEADYEEQLLGSITDRDLRKIFPGLCGK